MMPRPLRCLVLSVAALLLFVATPIAAQQAGSTTTAATAPATTTTVVYVVRHAEKVPDGTQDPPLSQAGRRRVETLVRMFADAGLTAVHTSPYTRTRETAGPVARAHGLTPQEYDPHELQDFARRLAGAGGTHLVVGHSDTNPDLVRALGGEAEPMPETNYGIIYEVTIAPDGVHTVVMGYAP